MPPSEVASRTTPAGAVANPMSISTAATTRGGGGTLQVEKRPVDEKARGEHGHPGPRGHHAPTIATMSSVSTTAAVPMVPTTERPQRRPATG